MSTPEIVGRLALQAVPDSIGAMLARGQLGAREEEEVEERRHETYGGALLPRRGRRAVHHVDVAPTEEVVVIAQMMTGWRAVVLVLNRSP